MIVNPYVLKQKKILVKKKEITSRERAIMAARLASEKKGQNIVLMDMRGKSDFCDWFVLISVSSSRRLQTIVKSVDKGMSLEKIKPLRIEGRGNPNWALLDYGDVVVHVFHSEVRGYYALEELWADALKEDFEEICTKKKSNKTSRISS